eukprot:scaffold581_cov124-Isochrysis_galbana.AAC.2
MYPTTSRQSVHAGPRPDQSPKAVCETGNPSVASGTRRIPDQIPNQNHGGGCGMAEPMRQKYNGLVRAYAAAVIQLRGALLR